MRCNLFRSIVESPLPADHIQTMAGQGAARSSVHHGRTLLAYDYLTDAAVDGFADNEVST